jgi:hypothetical protein
MTAHSVALLERREVQNSAIAPTLAARGAVASRTSVERTHDAVGASGMPMRMSRLHSYVGLLTVARFYVCARTVPTVDSNAARLTRQSDKSSCGEARC